MRRLQRPRKGLRKGVGRVTLEERSQNERRRSNLNRLPSFMNLEAMLPQEKTLNLKECTMSHIVRLITSTFGHPHTTPHHRVQPAHQTLQPTVLECRPYGASSRLVCNSWEGLYLEEIDDAT